VKHELIQYLSMGGYGKYIWTCYGVAAAVLVFNIIHPLRKKRFLLRNLRDKLIRQESMDDT